MKNPSALAVVLHTIGVFATGGLWLIVLIIWYILKKK